MIVLNPWIIIFHIFPEVHLRWLCHGDLLVDTVISIVQQFRLKVLFVIF